MAGRMNHVWVAVLAGCLVASVRGAVGQEHNASRERELLAVLRAETPEADRALACKGLAIHGTAAAVPDLAALLANERLASWARIALEAIPGPESAAALRGAAESLSGRLAIGAINSLGVRRDGAAVPMLERRLVDPDADLAAAAAAALGRIGSVESAEVLGRALAAGRPDVDQVAEAMVVCAERLQAGGRTAEATALHDAVRRSSASEQRRAEATRGAILSRGAAGLPLLAELLAAPSPRLFNMGLHVAREAGRGAAGDGLSADVDALLLARIGPETPPGRVPLVIAALADRTSGRGSEQAQQALGGVAEKGPREARLAAIEALGRIGGPGVVGRLLPVAAADDAGIESAALAALASLPGADVDREIQARLTAADAATLPALVTLVGERRIPAVAAIVPLVDHPEPRVRVAALTALGSVADLPALDLLVRKAVAARDQAEAEAAARALREASVRMTDREACAAKVASAIGAAGDRRGMLLETLAAVGGSGALAAVAAAARSGDDALEDAATRLLGKWMTADAAPTLIELAQPTATGRYRTRALRGYLRIARQFVLPDDERAAMCRQALAVAEDPADRKGVLEILRRYPSSATLAVAREAARLPGLEADGQAVIAAIEEELRTRGGPDAAGTRPGP